MITYTYIKNIISSVKLEDYLTPTFSNISSVTYNQNNNNLDITFSIALSYSDKKVLSDLLYNYQNPSDDINYHQIILNTSALENSDEEWSRVCEWIEDGESDLCLVHVNSHLIPTELDDTLPGIFTYYVRLLDVTNNIVLGEIQLYNDVKTVYPITITNFTMACNTDIELQVKRDSQGSDVVISTVLGKYV
jgi:hypothetical protein